MQKKPFQQKRSCYDMETKTSYFKLSNYDFLTAKFSNLAFMIFNEHS